MFDKDYFINSKISNYSDYTKKKYDLLCKELIYVFNIKKTDRIVDFGCATGNLIKEFVDLGYDRVNGTDISYRAIEYGKNQNKLGDHVRHYDLNILKPPKEYVLLLDVLEHIPDVKEIKKVINRSKYRMKEGIILRVPVSKTENGRYVLDVSENDKTHVQRHTKQWRINLFRSCGLRSEPIYCKNIYDSEGVLAVFLHR